MGPAQGLMGFQGILLDLLPVIPLDSQGKLEFSQWETLPNSGR